MRTLTVILALSIAGVAAAPDARAGDLASNAGCSVDCIRNVFVYPSTNGVGIRVETDTPARIRIELRERATDELVAVRSSDALRKALVALGGSLENDTLYAVEVTATDSENHVNRRYGTFRTLRPGTILDDSPIGDLSSGAGCAAQCIRTAGIDAGLRAARMTVNTNVPARLMITASRDEPLPTSQGPAFLDPEVDIRTSGLSKEWSGELLGLVADERYNVIVRAIDANGRMSVREGEFETAERHVIVTFERIRVSYDGDKGSNRGELTFHGKINGYWRIKRPEGKVKSNSTVHFPNGGGVGLLDVTRWIDLKVHAVERDSMGTCWNEFGTLPFDTLSGSRKERCERRTWNTAVGQFDLDEVFQQDGLLPGYGGWSSLDKTIYADRGGIRFQVDVNLEVWSE